MGRAKLWKRWRKWAFVLGIFALAIPVSSAVLVRTTGTRHRLHELAGGAIHSELGLDATIGTVQLQLFPLALVARDITLDDPVYGRIARADELRIRPSFRALLRGALDLNAIEIRRAKLRLVVRNGQIRNLPPNQGPPGPDRGPELPFGELAVLDSTLFVDAEPDASGELRNVDLRVHEVEDGIAIDVASGRGWLRHRGGREQIDRVVARLSVERSALRVEELDVRTPQASVAVERAYLPMPFADHGNSGRVVLSYDLAHTERVAALLGEQLPRMRGRVEVQAELESRGRDQRARGTITTHDVHIEQYGLGESGRIRFSADRQRVRILRGSQVATANDGGLVDVEGTISLDPERGFPLDVAARVNDLSFARLMGTLGVTENAIVEWMFDGTLRLAGTLDPIALHGPVALSTRDFVVSHGPYHRRPIERVVGVSRGDFRGRWSIRPDGVRFEQLVGELPHSRISGDVLLGFDNTLRVHARAEVADLRDITPLDRFPLAGLGSANVSIDGTFQDPHVTGHLRMADFVFDEFRLGTVESDAELDPDGLGVHFASVSALKNESRYRVDDLYLNFHDDRFEASGLLDLDGFTLADLYHTFGLENDERFAGYQGLARGEASLHYTNGFPGDSPSGTLDVDMNLGFDWASLDDYRFTDGRLVAHWRWLDWSRGAHAAELAIAHLSLRKSNGTLEVEGNMSVGGELRMTAIADRLALRDIEGIGDRLPGLDGVASVIGHVGGNIDVMRAELDVGVTNVTYDGHSLGDGRFYVRLTDRDDPWVTAARSWDRRALPPEPCAHARSGLAYSDWAPDPPIRTADGPEERLARPMAYLVCGSALDGALAVDVALGRTEPLPIRGLVTLEHLDLSPLLPRTPDDRPLTGALSGMLALEAGALKRPETLAGSIVLSEVRVAEAEDLEVHNLQPVELAFAGGVINVETARFAGPNSHLRVRGHASLESGLALSLNGDVDLGILARLSSTVTDADGRISVRLNVTGPFADPELYGEATVRDGAFRLASFEAPVEHLTGAIQFSQRSVVFDRFSADVAGGHLRASGEAQLREQGIERYGFDVVARDVRYAFGEGIDTAFGGHVRLAWSDGERLPTLSGELSLDRLEYTRPIELRSLGDMAARAVAGVLPWRRQRTEVHPYDPAQDAFRLDLRVTQTAPFHLENNLADAEVRLASGQPFRIVGTDQRYGFSGAMEITRGRIIFQNNEFEVRRGVIQFDDVTRINPHIDVEASTEIQRQSDLSAPSWRINLALAGPYDSLRLRTWSEPELDEQDILMLLAFGMTRGELQHLQQGGELASAAMLEAITSISGVDREVRRALPVIDDIRVTTRYSPRTGRSEPQISVGRRIADRVRLGATTGVGESRDFRASLDVQLNENQRVGLSYDNYNATAGNSLGNLGIDWGVRLEFE